jgi:hypothetical protein
VADNQTNPYAADAADYVNGALQTQASVIRQNLGAAASTSPDTEAKALQLSRVTATPLDTVRNMADTIRAQAAAQTVDAQGIVEHYPATAGLLQDPDKAKLVHDDVPGTAKVEQAARAVAAPQAPSIWTNFWKGAGLYGMRSLAEAARAIDLAGAAIPVTLDAITGGTVRQDQYFREHDDTFNNAVDYWTPKPGEVGRAGQVAGGLAGGIVQAVVNPALLVGTAQLGTAEDLSREGVSPGMANAVGAIAGASNALGLKLPFIGKTAIARVASGVVGNTTLGVTTAAASRSVLQAAGYDQQAQQYDPWDVGARSLDALLGAAFGGLAHVEAHAAGRAEQGAAAVQTLADAAVASKLRERDPQSFHELVEQATKDGPVSDVWIDAKQFDQSLAQSGVPREALRATMPDVDAQLDTALATGGDVRIPVTDFATHLAGTDVATQLLPELRMAPDAMNLREAREFQANAEGLLREQADKTDQLQQDVGQLKADSEQVRDQIKAQLDDAKRFTPAVNDAYATMMASFYMAQAHRLGLLPSEVMARYPVHIGAENPAGDALQQGQRGFFDPQTQTIGLLNGADLSTFIHESGHFYLDALGKMAAHPEAPEGVRADMQKVLSWAGVKGTPEQSALDRWQTMTLDEQREAHEQFARGFEAYVMEGKAPSPELRTVFQRFRSWLVSIYRNLSALKVNLSDEVRGVMDRLLASDEAIRAEQAQRAYEPLFRTPEDIAKFGVDAAGYHQLADQATQTAIEQLQTKGLRDMAWLGRERDKALRRLNDQATEARKKIEAEVKGEVYQEPTYQAWQWLTGKLPKEGEEPTAGRFNSTDLALRMMVPPEVEMRLRDLGMVAAKSTEGLHPDLVADMFGFGSGRELIDALVKAEPPESVIEGLTDQRMLERHGELSSPDAIAKAADAAVHNEARARFIATELAALEQASRVRQDTGRKTSAGRAITVDALAQAARKVAEDTIARLKIRDVNPTRFTAAETRAARDAGEALGKGDTAAAAAAKRAQMLNNRLAKTAMDVVDEIGSGLKYLRKFDKAGTRDAVGAEYMSQIDALLDRFDLRASTPLNAAERRQSLLEWVQSQRDKGLDPAVPDKLLDEAQRMPYREMSVEDFRGLLDSVKSIEHLGRLKNKLLDLKEQRDLDALVDEALTTLKTLPQREAAEPRNPGVGGTGLDKINAKYLQGKSLLRSADASLLKMEQLFDWLDAHNPHGVFNRVVFRRIAEAQGVESDLLKEVTGRLKELHESLPRDAQRDMLQRYTLPELPDSKTGKPSSMLKKEILALAMNVGNESNFGKLLEGEGWTERGVWSVLDRHMTKADWDFVQGVWDTLDSLWPKIAAMEKRLSGVEPPRIEARPITTKHGDYRGGYYPVIYDPLRAFDVDMRNARNEAALFENTFSRPATARGHTVARVDYARPLFLSLDVLPRHLSQVVHDLAYREAIVDANKFLTDSRVRGGIEDTLGREYYKQLRPWLQAIANDKVYDERGLAFWDKAAHWARTTTTMVGLGFRATTMMVHGATAASNSVGEIGARWFLSGLKGFVGTPDKMVAARDFVFERSPEMRNRMNETDRDVRDALREMDLHGTTGAEGAVTRAVDPVKRFAYYGISMLDMASALPTWLGAYNKALHEGRTEEQAIYESDKAVRNAHGGGGTKDLAAIQRGSEFQKLFTMFYSFWNHFYNRQRDIGRTAAGIPDQVRQGDYAGARRDFAMVLARSWFYFVIPQLLHAALKPPAPGSQDEDKHWLAWAAEEMGLGMFAGVPIVRDVASSIGTGRDYNPTPAAQVVTTIGHSAKDLKAAANSEPVSDKWLKHAVQTAGYVFGLPTGQLSTSTQFLWDVEHGNQAPDGLADWWHGLIYGTTAKH